MANDPRSIVFGGANQGWATVLGRQEGDFLGKALEVDQLRLANEAARIKAKKEEQSKQLDRLAKEGMWTYFKPSLGQAEQELIQMLGSDEYDQMEASLKINKLARLMQGSMQLQDRFKEAQQIYKEEGELWNNPLEYLKETYIPDNSIETLESASTELFDPRGFLGETGGSKYINKSKAFQDLMDSAFKDWITTKAEGDITRKRYGYAINEFSNQVDEQKVKAFNKFNPKTGKFEVANPEALIEDGILDLFKAEPRTARIIEDEATVLAGDDPVTDEHRVEVLRKYLTPYSQRGERSMTTERRFQNDYVYAQGIGENREKASATDWLQRAKAGDQSAWDLLKGEKIDGYTVDGVLYDPKLNNIRLQLTKRTENNTIEGTSKDIPLGGYLTDQDILQYYFMTKKDRRTGFTPDEQSANDPLGINQSDPLGLNLKK